MQDWISIALAVGRLQAELKALRRDVDAQKVLLARGAVLVVLWGLAIIATVGNDRASELAAAAISAWLR